MILFLDTIPECDRQTDGQICSDVHVVLETWSCKSWSRDVSRLNFGVFVPVLVLGRKVLILVLHLLSLGLGLVLDPSLGLEEGLVNSVVKSR